MPGPPDELPFAPYSVVESLWQQDLKSDLLSLARDQESTFWGCKTYYDLLFPLSSEMLERTVGRNASLWARRLGLLAQQFLAKTSLGAEATRHFEKEPSLEGRSDCMIR